MGRVRWQLQSDQGQHAALESLRAPLDPVCVLTKQILRESPNLGFQGNARPSRGSRGARAGFGLQAGFVGEVALDILWVAQSVPPGFWDGFRGAYLPE